MNKVSTHINRDLFYLTFVIGVGLGLLKILG